MVLRFADMDDNSQKLAILLMIEACDVMKDRMMYMVSHQKDFDLLMKCRKKKDDIYSYVISAYDMVMVMEDMIKEYEKIHGHKIEYDITKNKDIPKNK